MRTYIRLALTFGLAILGLQAPAQIMETYLTNLNALIPDGNWSGFSDARSITSSIARLANVRVKLQVTGEYNGDLYCYLRHVGPFSTNFCVLLNRPGRSSTLPYGYADTGLNVTFDAMAASGNIHTYQLLTNPPPGTPLMGTWQPDGRQTDPGAVLDTTPVETSLSAFNGLEATGAWTLFIADVDMGATNTLMNWALELSGAMTPGVTWQAPSDIVYGSPLNSSQLNASAGSVLGTFAYQPPANAVLSAGTHTLQAIFTPDNPATYLSVTSSVTIKVLPKALTVAANSASKSYDGLAFSGGNGVTYTGFVNGETAAVLGGTIEYTGTSQGAINMGSYFIVPAGLTSANYTITFASGTLSIHPTPLSVRANDAIKLYDGLAFSGGNGITCTGFVNGETVAALGGPLTYGGTSQNAVHVGSYVIVPGGLTSANYTITFLNGSLSINPAPLSVRANDAIKTYDGLAFSGGNGVTYSGFVNGESGAVLGGTLAYSGTSQGAVNAGSYIITAAGLTSANYAITFLGGSLSINPAPLIVKANDASKTYNGMAFSGGNGVTYSGFVNGETASALGGALIYNGTSQGAVNAGSYVINPGGLTSANYAIQFTSGALSINPTALSIKANDASKTYDGLAFSGGNGVTYVGFVNGETSTVLHGTLAYSGTSQGAVDAGSYVITPVGLSNDNYTITPVSGNLTISKAATAGVVAVSENPVRPGKQVTFTASFHAVAPGGGTPSGSVQFVLAGNPTGPQAVLSSGLATHISPGLSAGTNSVFAEYAGNGNFLGSTNRLIPDLVVNAAPVAQPDSITRYGTNDVKVAIATLLSNDVDPEGDLLTFVGVSSTSTNGGLVSREGNWVRYIPPPNSTNPDEFSYTITDGHGAPVTGIVLVQVIPEPLPSPNLAIQDLGSGSFLIQFNGVPGLHYRIEYSENPIGPAWLPLGVATADPTGLCRYVDIPPQGSPLRYYRSVYP